MSFCIERASFPLHLSTVATDPLLPVLLVTDHDAVTVSTWQPRLAGLSLTLDLDLVLHHHLSVQKRSY